jgi:hypothetical protein
VNERRQNKVIDFKDPAKASKRSPRDAELEQGFASLRGLRNSTAREELPERLKHVVEKLRRR